MRTLSLTIPILLTSSALADNLQIDLVQERLVRYQPIFLYARLSLDGWREPGDLEQAEMATELRRLRRRFRIELHDSVGNVVCDGTVLRARFDAEDVQAGVAQSVGVVILTEMGSHRNLPCANIGSFKMVVRDIENGLVAAPINIVVEAGNARESAGGKLFADAFPETVGLFAEEPTTDASQLLTRLIEEYPDTPHAIYTTAAVAIAGYIKHSRGNGSDIGQEVWLRSAKQLVKAADSLPSGHPLKNEALLYAACAFGRALDFESSNATLEALPKNVPSVVRQVAKLRSEIENIRAEINPKDEKRLEKQRP